MIDEHKQILIVSPEIPEDHAHEDDDFTHLGLAADVNMLGRNALDRRRLLGLGALGVRALLGAASFGSAAILGGGGRPLGPPPGGAGGMPPGQGDADTVTSANGQCHTLPTETQGPYPADGSGASGQTLNILKQSGIVRSDLTHSLKTGHVAVGVPMTLTLQLVDIAGNCAPLAGHVIYVWHCTAGGEYSLYSKGITGEDYLRGAQVTDAQGRVTFKSIYPGCYAGRWPHIHFEVYPNLAAAALGNVNQNVSLVSQIAMPETASRAVYADSRYTGSTRNLNNMTLASDNVFGDGAKAQTPQISGNAKMGYTVGLTVGLKS